MIPNNNLSVLPWYTSIEQQNARKWWVYGRVYPLFTPAGYLLPFQIIRPHLSNAPSVTAFRLYTKNGQLIGNFTQQINEAGIYIKQFASLGYDVIVFPSLFPIFSSLENGQYYAQLSDNSTVWVSEIFTVVNDIEPYLKIEWYDTDDFVMDAGTIVYKNPSFKNVLYLDSSIAKPEYPFDEEGETRDGYFFPIKQISEKHYRFKFFASEYLLDVMRLIRMADYATIEYHGQKYNLDTFLITPEWEDNGDVASVEAEFDTATVAKKIGRGYLAASGNKGDFNNDFNNDFKNQQS